MLNLMRSDQANQELIERVVEFYNTDLRDGLSEAEAQRRLKSYGPNDFEINRQDPLWRKYLEQFKNPLIFLLLASAVVSLLMGEWDNAVSITMAIVIVVTVGFVQEYRSEKSLEALARLVPHQCHCVRQGRVQTFLARDLVPGDIVLLTTGDRVPADLRLFEVVDLSIDESSFTGETKPACKRVYASRGAQRDRDWERSGAAANVEAAGELSARRSSLDDVPLSPDFSQFRQTSVGASGHSSIAVALETPAKRRALVDNECVAFMGTLVQCGSAKGIVIATGDNSEFGEIFRMMRQEEPPPTPLQQSMNQLGKHLSMASFVVIGLIMLCGWLQGRYLVDMFQIGVSLAVAAIPEGLPIVVTVTLALGVMRMAKRKAICKKLPVVETLGCVDVICCDKTGTLTKNEMTVVQLYTSEGIQVEVTGVGYSSAGQVLCNGEVLKEYTYPAVSKLVEVGDSSSTAGMGAEEVTRDADGQVGMVCNNAMVADGQLRGQPTEGALLVLAQKLNLLGLRARYTRLQEWPFNTETKWMAVRCAPRDEMADDCYFMKGALERVLRHCTHFYMSGASVPMTSKHEQQFLQVGRQFGLTGLRVLALAYGPNLGDLTFIGMVGMLDPPRDGVIEAIETLLDGDVCVKMLTGDSYETAVGIGRRLGLLDDGCAALSGDQVDQMSIEELCSVIDRAIVVYRSSPRHKNKIVRALQANRHVVAMTGDGVNDAVALRSAQIGIAMGQAGTDVCKEAADMILVEDNFSTILSAIEEGKAIFYNIRNFVRFQLSTSIAALLLIALSTLCRLPNPLNPMQILWINILMDGPPAQSLGVEPVDDDVTSQPPRRPGDAILNRRLVWSILLSAAIIVTGTLYVFHGEMDEHAASLLARASRTAVPAAHFNVNLDSHDTSEQHWWNHPRNHLSRHHTTMTFTCFVLFDMFNALGCRSQTKSIFEIGFFSNRAFLMAIGLSLLGQLLVIYWGPLQAIFQTEALSLHDMLFLVGISSSVFVASEVRKAIERVIERARMRRHRRAVRSSSVPFDSAAWLSVKTV